jgi:glutathione S-transferase
MNSSSPTLLYQFALSHYCEKARWALDYKGVDYKIIDLVPGLHLFTTKRLASRTTVPILIHERKVIQDSTDIISYLDRAFPENMLTPDDENLKKEALELEEYFDKEIGVHLRRYIYHHVLGDRKLVCLLLLQKAPWYASAVYSVFFPAFRKLMRKGMNINPESSQRSAKRLTDALGKLNQQVRQNDFLVGNRFSRADLTAAALLAPLCTPKEHSFEWPPEEIMPEPLLSFKRAHQQDPFFTWVLKMYSEYR